MNQPAIDWSKPRRQPAAALILLLYKALLDLLKFIWPLLIILILRTQSSSGRSGRYEIIALVISILSLLRSVVEYFNFRFSIVNDELIIRKGLFIKKTITLPLEKIQSVDIEQPWLHALLHVSRLSFDTAGTEKTEVQIEALDKLRSVELKDLVLRSKKTGRPAEGEAHAVTGNQEKVLISLSGRDLLKLSLSANHLEAFFLLLAFVYSVIDNIGISGNEYKGILKWFAAVFQSETVGVLVFFGAAVLVLSVGVSVARVVLTYASFIISLSEKGFRIRSGLINKNEKIVPFRKIQFISWKANWIRRKIGLFLLQFHVAGGEQVKNKMQVKVPVTRGSFIPVLLEAYHQPLETAAITPVRMDKRYVGRGLLFSGMIPVALTLPFLYIRYGNVALFVLLLLPLVWMAYRIYQQRFFFWPDTVALQIRKGIFGVQELILKWDKIQSVRLKQNLYQRRHGLATVELHTAGGRVTVRYIKLHQAQQIRDYALYKVETATESWM